MDMDATDRKILYALDVDSSLRYSELAKAARTSAELVRYRVLRLKHGGIIQQTACDLDFNRLGFISCQLLIRLQSLSAGQVKDIARTLASFPSVSWLARVEGEYHLEVVLRIQDPGALAVFLDSVTSAFGHVIAKRSLLINLEQTHVPRDYLLKRKARKSRPKRAASAFRTAILDSVDYEIVRLIQEDARQTLQRLASRLQDDSGGEIALTPEAVRHRLNRLRERGIIRGYLLFLNNRAMGQVVYRVLVSLSGASERARAELIENCMSEPRCVFYSRTVGEWDMEIEFEVATHAELREILARVTTLRGGSVRDYSVLEMVESFRFNLVFQPPSTRASLRGP